MRTFKINLAFFGISIECMLTPIGEEKITKYIQELEIERKEILDAGNDTAYDTNIPTMDDIIQDVEESYGRKGVPAYWNYWPVTDSYESEDPLFLHLGEDIITVKAAMSLIEKSDRKI